MGSFAVRQASRSDVDALARLREGDRDTLRTLFRRHMPVVFGAAFEITRNAADAEEAAQDTFFLLWQKRADLVIVGESVLPWLIATARFHASNRRRAAIRRPTVALLDSSDAGTAPDPEASAIAAELQRRLATVIGGLAPVDQRLLAACAVEGMSYDEAAVALGLSHGAVRNRLSRAKHHIRLQIASERTES